MLENYINTNIEKDKDDIFYNEEFCNLTLDYMSSFEITKEDEKFLNDNGYDTVDFYYNEIEF